MRAAFSGPDSEAANELLQQYGLEPHERERERVQLAIVELSAGDIEKLRYFVTVAKTDYRDILHWQATGPLTAEQGEKLQRAARELIERWGKKS